jgi:hypothetical protein
MIDKKSLLLVAASTGFTLLLAEVALRLLTPYGPHSAPVTRAAAKDSDGDVASAISYIAQMSAAPGTDRAWFSEDPKPLPRAKVDPREQELYDAYVKRGLYGPQAQYIWNRMFLGVRGCQPDGTFKNYPETVRAFDPPGKTEFPRYRFPPNATTPAGLVTNQFGMRGPQIDLVKPPNTVRIAFLGASTTINVHSFAFSYPERTVFWLNRYAEANHLNVHFDVLNAGREGIGSSDIAGIVHDELVPLDPDLLIYYEGANQFYVHTLIDPPMGSRGELDPNDAIVAHKLPLWMTDHLALADVTDRALNRFSSVGEPQKPAYRLKWPEGVSEGNTDPDQPHLPLDLPAIIKDLDSIRSQIKPYGGELAVAAFERFANSSMVLSPVKHKNLYQQLNTVLWPLTYSDIHRLADYQNRVFQTYASKRQIPFLDIPSSFPQDPGLFSDSVHMTETGERVKAWVFFQQLVPYVRKRIDNGDWPRKGTRPALPPPVNYEPVEARVCAAGSH